MALLFALVVMYSQKLRSSKQRRQSQQGDRGNTGSYLDITIEEFNNLGFLSIMWTLHV